MIARSDLISTRGDVRYSWIGIVSFGVGCAEPGYPGAYTRSACFLGFIAEQFNLKADFPQPGDHPGWSTDCQAGASRRSSAASRSGSIFGLKWWLHCHFVNHLYMRKCD